MKADSGKTESVWMQKDVPQFQSLNSAQSADVCVIGAGISGITCAYLLSKKGKSVVLLDDGPVCGGETQRTTAHLSNEIDDRYFEIERMHGKKKARLAFESHTAAIKLIETLAAEENIDCEFERLDGYLFLAEGTKQSIIDDEFDAATRAGFDNLEKLDALPFGKKTLCIRFPNQAQFHVLKYLDGLLRACIAQGVRIFANTHVAKVEGGAPPSVITEAGHEVHAGAVIVTTNSPIHGNSEFLKQAAYRSYVIAGRVPKGTVARALYWDTLDAYHYVRLQNVDGEVDYELLIAGGEDHKTGQEKDTESCFTALEEWTRANFPMMEQIDFRWSGQVYEPADALAFIGKDPKANNVYMATGDSGQGMTHGTIAGILLTDLICGRTNPWAELYDPGRKVFAAPVEFMKENMNSGVQYLRNIFAPDHPSIEALTSGEGTILNHGLEKIAVYKDESGSLHEMSALCPHMHAVVTWNSTEKSWDCPAHGSRFKATGEVIDGPANSDLSPCRSCVPDDLSRKDRNDEEESPEHKKSA